jgi:NADPH:quinone reductase-like Zn-dependent oxidoreductase
MATMRVVQVPRPRGGLEIVERPIPEPGPGTVRIKVQACGICHGDRLRSARRPQLGAGPEDDNAFIQDFLKANGIGV